MLYIKSISVTKMEIPRMDINYDCQKPKLNEAQ